MSAVEMARFVGEYKFETIPMEIRFFEEGGKLMAQATGQKSTRLMYQGSGEFRPDFDTTVKFVFAAGEGPAESFMLHQGGEHKARRKP
jgi:hypothetical protein